MKITHVLATGLVVALAGTGIAVATADTGSGAGARSASGEAIRACVDRKSGDVRIFRDGKCRDGEKVVTWAARGPQGPRGLPGPSGSGAGGGSVGYLDEPDNLFLPASMSETTVLTASALPDGSYVATYTAGGQVSIGSGSMTCRLYVGGTTRAISEVRMGVGVTTVAMTGAFTVTGGGNPTPQVKCVNDIDTVIQNQTLTMVQVGTLVVGTQPRCPRSEDPRRVRC